MLFGAGLHPLGEGQARLADYLDDVLSRLAGGALASLNAYFYLTLGRSFTQAAVEDPPRAYREATRVMPEGMVRLVFRAMLRSLGASPGEVEAALEALRAGDGSRFLNVAERALRAR